MNHKKDLNILYNQLLSAKIPPFSSNDTLNDWIVELIEMDAFLAGMLASKAGGTPIIAKQLPDLSALENKLKDINITNNNDKNSFFHCVEYLGLLKKIRESLK